MIIGHQVIDLVILISLVISFIVIEHINQLVFIITDLQIKDFNQELILVEHTIQLVVIIVDQQIKDFILVEHIIQGLLIMVIVVM